MCTKKELPACPVETTLTMISDKWKVLILRDLLTGTKRFSELKKSLVGVSQKVLTSQLREMEENGLVERKAYPEVPPRVGVQPNPAGPEPAAHHGCHAGVGRTVQTTECVTARRAAAVPAAAPGIFCKKGETAPWSGSYCWRMTKVWSPG